MSLVNFPKIRVSTQMFDFLYSNMQDTLFFPLITQKERVKKCFTQFWKKKIIIYLRHDLVNKKIQSIQHNQVLLSFFQSFDRFI